MFRKVSCQWVPPGSQAAAQDLRETLCREVKTHPGGEQRIWCIYGHFSSVQPRFCSSFTPFAPARRRASQCLHISKLDVKNIFTGYCKSAVGAFTVLKNHAQMMSAIWCWGGVQLVEKLKALFFNIGTELPYKNRSTVPSNLEKTVTVNCRSWMSPRQQECMQVLIPAHAALEQPSNWPAQAHLKTEEIELHQLVS